MGPLGRPPGRQPLCSQGSGSQVRCCVPSWVSCPHFEMELGSGARLVVKVNEHTQSGGRGGESVL